MMVALHAMVGDKSPMVGIVDSDGRRFAPGLGKQDENGKNE